MIPKIKKKINNFILDESGIVSKKSLLKMGMVSLILTVSGSEIVQAGASCTGRACSELYDECDPQYNCNTKITVDMEIIFEDQEIYGKTANLFDDQPGWHISETQSNAHQNTWGCDNECYTKWAYADHNNSSTYSWACIHWVRNEDSEHWNAGHHRNDISLSSEDNLKIEAKHGNMLYLVDQKMYPVDYCGEDKVEGE